MPVITPPTFDALNGYKSVVYGQQVPLVDADINEESDIRRFQMQSALKWILGNGTPVGHDDAFRIVASGLANDFEILSGTPPAVDALENVGRCFVNGLEVLIPISNGFMFTDQPLHESQAGSAALAAALGVAEISLTVPSADGVWTIYVDVWHRLVTAAEEPSLIHPALGVESSARRREEFAIRVREGTTAPQPGDADFVAEHHYLALARIDRRNGDPLINADDISDAMRRQLHVQSMLDVQQMTSDAFGPGYTFTTTGNTQLPFSLREVINAMLRSGRAAPLGPSALITTDGPQAFITSTLDASGNRWLFWIRGTSDIVFQRQTDGQTWGAPELRQTLPGQVAGLAVVAPPDGTLWLFWSTAVNPMQFDVFGQVFDGTTWQPEFTVNAGAANVFAQRISAVSDSANQVMVVWQEQSGSGISMLSRRYLGSPAAAQAIVDVNVPPPGDDLEAAPALVVTDTDEFHLFGTQGTTTPVNIVQTTWDPGGPAWTAPTVIGSMSAGVAELGAAADRFGGIWLVYADGQASLTGRYIRSGFVPDPTVLIETANVPRFPAVARDVDGNLRVYYRPQGLEEIHEVGLISEI